MVRGDKDAAAQANTDPNETEEIDRIMKEIEDLEKKMDAPAENTEKPATLERAAAESPVASIKDEAPMESDSIPSARVVALRPDRPDRPEVTESMAETDAVPALDEPLLRDSQDNGSAGLAMKVGGCTEVSLEFTRAGMTVSLSCTENGLCITTDQGAEFRIPFKRGA